MLPNKVVFLDRDGVINQDSPDYIKSWDEFTFIPRSLEAIRELTDHGYAIILITNQSVIRRQFVTPEGLNDIHERMKDEIRVAGGHIQDIFFCPHTPDDHCTCRKPKPGLILQARDKYKIELSAAVMVGDSVKDILCGKNAGCQQSVLVKTGNGISALKTLAVDRIDVDFIAIDLYDAVQWIFKASRRSANPAQEQTP